MDFRIQRSIDFLRRWLMISFAVHVIIISSIYAIDFSSVTLENDGCSTYDSCNVSDFFRTCSCQEDCTFYGTCCTDSPNFDGANNGGKNFFCYGKRLPQPVFFRKTCLPGYRGDKQIISSCENPDDKLSDLMRSIPVSSSKTLITYWNWNCAICNDEKTEDLSFWTVQISCTIGKSHKRYDAENYRRNLVYQEEVDGWGVYEDSKFKECPIDFFQPTFLTGKLRYCAPNLIEDCPESWKDDDVRGKCRVIHGERKDKGTDVYYKNVYCAMCNGISMRNLECFGRSYKTFKPLSDYNTMKMIFSLNPSKGEHSKYDLACFRGKRYDPFLKMCRNTHCGIVSSQDEGMDTCLHSASSSTLFSSSFNALIGLILVSLLFGRS